MGNSLGKLRRKRRKASHCRKQPAKSTVPSDTMERIIHLHNVEHKGFRKIGDELGMTKDRVYRIYKQHSATFEEQKQRMFSQDPQYLSLKKTEQEIERKTKRDLALDEIQQKIKDHQMQRARTSVGVEEIFSDPEETLEFARHTAKQYKPFMLFCRTHKLKPAQTLADLIVSKEDYMNTAEEEGEVQDLSEYIDSGVDLFLLDQEEEEEKRFLRGKFLQAITDLKCECGSDILKFIIIDSKLICNVCNAKYVMFCPMCKATLRVDSNSKGDAVYRCPSCKFTIEQSRS